MNEFSKYFLRLFNEILEDIKNWFKGLWQTLIADFIENVKNYFNIIKEYSADFNFLSWLMFVITTILIFVLIFFIGVRIWLVYRKYVRFRKQEIEKDELMEEIADLNSKVVQLIDEKNKIMALKVSQLGLKPGQEVETTTEVGDDHRFTKLSNVDLKYINLDTTINMSEEEHIDLTQLVERFINYSCTRLGLYYDKKTISLFFAGLATSKLIILEGISGTGKTSLPYAMSKFFKNDASIIPVQPSWRDRAELLGYLNEFTKKFNETDFLKSIYEVMYRRDVNFIVLDEMNLARIEYYFAEFLSILEIPNPEERKIDLVPDDQPNDPKLIKEGKITIPQNVWFIGTANKDDSTFTITDKVYDRAVKIDLSKKGVKFDADLTDQINFSYEYLHELFDKAQEGIAISEEIMEKFLTLDEYLIETFKVAFGNRILKQINDFVPVYVACGGREIDGLDYLFAHKVLRKFEAINISFMKDELNILVEKIKKLFGEDNFTESINYIKQLQKMV